jgi:putative nucleotidyltransferase with HDIG domain
MSELTVKDVFDIATKVATERKSDKLYVPIRLPREDFTRAWVKDRKAFTDYIDQIITSLNPINGLHVLMESGFFGAVLPEFEFIKNLGDADGLHKDVWQHTLHVINNAPNTLELRWSALCHDIGKAKTRKINRGRVTFHNHDIVGYHMVSNMDDRSGLFIGRESLRKTVSILVLNHLRPAQLSKNLTESSCRRLLKDVEGIENFRMLIALSRADTTTKHEHKRIKFKKATDALELEVERVLALDAMKKLPKYTMGKIIESFEVSDLKTHPNSMALYKAFENIRNTLELDLNEGKINAGPAEEIVRVFFSDKRYEYLVCEVSSLCKRIEDSNQKVSV